MNIMIIGCGKVGSRLASQLSADGHDVSIVDSDENAFEQLDSGFEGFKTCGIPIDQDVLRKAGIETCDALAAVSQDDNVNIMVSQMAREVFKVNNVLARIYDPKREDVFSHFGLNTICPTNITVEGVVSALIESGERKTVNLGCHMISFNTESVPRHMVGKLLSEIKLSENQQLYAIEHKDNSLEFYTGQRYKLETNDKVIISTLVD